MVRKTLKKKIQTFYDPDKTQYIGFLCIAFHFSCKQKNVIITGKLWTCPQT